MGNHTMGLCLLILVLSLPYISAEDATYTITAPNTIRRNSNFQIAVTNHGPVVNNLLKVDVQLIGEAYQQGTKERQIYSTGGIITVGGKTTRILRLTIGNWEPGNYRLVCNGTGAATFIRIAYLNFNNKQFSILIQMDKSIYQRGQLVHFRIVAFNSNLLPYKNNTLSVHVNDADGNRIKQWDVPAPKSGIFENELQLSDQPVLGNWVLYAQILDVVASEIFVVAEYTLPKFEVTVTPPPFITQDDVEFPVTVSALYTNGGQVSGTYLVNVTETTCTYPWYKCPSRSVVLTGSFKGTAQVIVRIGELLLGKSIYYGGSLTIVATVTEEFTGIKRNSSTTVTMYQNTLQLVVEQDSNFKPQIPHTFTVKLLRQNGASVSPSPNGPVNITVNYDEGFDPVVIRGEFGGDGTLSHTIVPPAYVQSLTITVLYKDLSGSGYSSLAQSLSNKFVSISVENKYPMVGDTLKVKVIATFKPSGPFSYQVVGRGAILIARTAVLVSSSFEFNLTRNMAPRVRIIGYYVTACGEIVGDSIDVSVAGVLQNQVTLQLSNNSTEPGKNVTISIDCKPDSTVGLLAVDQSVLLLRSGNDITNVEIVNELEGYDIGLRYYFNEYYGGIIRRPSYGGSFDDIFVFAGLEFFTNGLVYKANTCYLPMFGGKGILDDVGPIRIQSLSPEAGMVQPTRVRQYFPEVGLWKSIITNKNGKAELIYSAPDTITTWVISALSMNANDGLGTTDVPSNLTVSQKFFLVVNLPRFVIRTEGITLQVLVFNNLPQELSQVIVTLNKTDNPSAYDFLEPTGDNTNVLMKNIKVGANDVQLVTFRIQLNVVGYVYLNIKAVSALAGDQLLQPLLVKAEGFPQYKVNSVFIDLRKTSSFSTAMSITIPTTAVPDSQFIEFSAIGDIMAPVIANIKELLRMPSGCGEQNLLNFVPDVVIIKYLESIGQLSAEFKKTAISYLEAGYQTQLTFKRLDGSFSAFGKTDTNGSVWLTAYVVKSFVMAEGYITIDPNVIDGAKKFLASKQASDGQFIEDGRVIHKAMQGGTTIGLAMNAFVLIAFLENKNQNNSAYTAVIQKGVKYLEDNADSANNSYELAITCYALHLANSPMKNSVYTKLNARKITEGDLSYWSYSVSLSTGIETSYNVETTAYAALAFNLRPEITSDVFLPIVRWLISKRTSLGGYESSQDTVMAIQALATVGSKFAAPPNSSVQVTITYLSKSVVFNLTKENALVLQKEQILKETRVVYVRATGNGVGIVQLAWNYNIVNNSVTIPSFSVIPEVKRPNDQTYSVNILVSALYNQTNMVLVEFDCLSGYALDTDSLPSPGFIPQLTKVDKSNGNTHVTFYFEFMVTTPKSVSITVNAVKQYDVFGLKNALIVVYDYYEPSKRKEAFYNLPATIG